MPFLYVGGFLYLVLEIFLIVDFIHEFGIWTFFLEIIISGVLGIFILFRERLHILEDLSQMFSGTMTPMGFLSSNFFRMLGAIFLILPGVLSDCLGIILECVGFIIANHSFLKKSPEHFENFDRPSKPFFKDDEVIDVEIISDDKNPKQEKR
ncbi:FxsA family protein [Helicobacter sp. 11S02596-1]|uniref:FxsA family protein n=1 Tax=Helicobacter sp. 11S02596-1 TaxID=1476194 RepID=UPI000BA5C929|nr:FxsA family protein [Helicobacter sp. 11S02596-1]PAF41650.1 hypothetical protein BJI48_08155 [Helicobacter sp. 11S02596-1]